MRYARIDSNTVAEIIETDGDITTMFHPSLVFVACSDDVEIGHEYSNGKFAAPVLVSQINLIADQYAAIDAWIKSEIKTKYDYDSFEETRAWYDSEVYGIEARRVNAWCCTCLEIQADIKSGKKEFDSVASVIKFLPPLEMEL